MPYLVKKKLDGSVVEQWEIADQPLVFGRGEQADCQIHDDRMSRRHFVIAPKEGGGYTLQDLQSTNGTYVNHVRVAEATLKPNDRIRAGQTVLTFVSEKPVVQEAKATVPGKAAAAPTKSS
jgi:pSer/pThr/pTyr-binding forkhead associated (FHA) protein